MSLAFTEESNYGNLYKKCSICQMKVLLDKSDIKRGSKFFKFSSSSTFTRSSESTPISELIP